MVQLEMMTVVMIALLFTFISIPIVIWMGFHHEHCEFHHGNVMIYYDMILILLDIYIYIYVSIDTDMIRTDMTY